MLAFVMIVGSLSALEGVVNAKAAATPKVKVSDVTIEGTVGTPIEEQTVEITITDGEFDTEQFYVGRDISEYFVKDDSYYGNQYFYNDVNNGSSTHNLHGFSFYKPMGLKAVITEADEGSIKCTISGTPLTPSQTEIHVYFKKSMLADNSGMDIVGHETNASAVWNIKQKDKDDYATSTLTMDASLTEDKLTGVAGQTEFDLKFTIQLHDAVFSKDIPKGEDVSIWFASSTLVNSVRLDLPVGLSVVVDEDIKQGDTSCTLRLKGTPTYSNSNYFIAYIPSSYVAGCTAVSNKYYASMNTNGTASVKFKITGPEGEPTYLAPFPQVLHVYAGFNYRQSSTYMAKVYFRLYNGMLRSIQNPPSNGHLYSNTKGNLDTDAPGFLYTPAKQGSNLTINTLTKTGAETICLGINGDFYTPGEYDISYFLPQDGFIQTYVGDTGYTPAVIRGKVNVMKPFQLIAGGGEIEVKNGAEAEGFVVLNISGYSLVKSFKDGVTTETLKYTVTDTLKNAGLNLTPVLVNSDTVIFKLSGAAQGKSKTIYIEDCVTLSYENFATNASDNSALQEVERFGEIAPNHNPAAVIKISGSIYGLAGQEIDYTPREDVKIYPTNASGVKVETTYINMTQEKLVTDISPKCYSIDGGSTWKEAKSGALNDKGFQKLLAKGMTFAIADKWDSSSKAPASDAVILTFSQTEKQPAKPKFKIIYDHFGAKYGESTGQFILGDSEGNIYEPSVLRAGYEIGIASGKTVNSDGYGVWPVAGGLTIAKIENNKVQKTVYFIKTMATETTPSSKEVKISVAGQQKAPKLKIDYKKEIIKGKEGMSVMCGENLLADTMSKEDAKAGIYLSGVLLVGVRTDIRLWIGATSKKPASAIQEISTAARSEAPLASEVYTLSAGKLKLKKGFEAYSEDKGKWGGLPKITDSCTILVRKAATAKGGKETDSTYAAGASMQMKVTYGVIDAEKGKQGVVSVVIEGAKAESSGSGSGSGSSTSGSGSTTSGSGS